MSDTLTLQELKEHCIRTLQFEDKMSSQINGIKFQSTKVEQEHRMTLNLILEHEQIKEHDAKVRADAIDEFVRCCKATESHLITNWEKPFGIDFEGIDVIAEQLKEKNNE